MVSLVAILLPISKSALADKPFKMPRFLFFECAKGSQGCILALMEGKEMVTSWVDRVWLCDIDEVRRQGPSLCEIDIDDR